MLCAAGARRMSLTRNEIDALNAQACRRVLELCDAAFAKPIDRNALRQAVMAESENIMLEIARRGVDALDAVCCDAMPVIETRYACACGAAS